jgi:hypothetical protein
MHVLPSVQIVNLFDYDAVPVEKNARTVPPRPDALIPKNLVHETNSFRQRRVRESSHRKYPRFLMGATLSPRLRGYRSNMKLQKATVAIGLLLNAREDAPSLTSLGRT